MNDEPNIDEVRKQALAEGYTKGWNEAMRSMESHVRLALAAAKATPFYGERNER